MQQRARRRAVLALAFVGGAALLRAAFLLRAGDDAFPVVVCGVAAVLAAGAVIGGPVPLGELTVRNAFDGVLVGAVLYVVFLVLRGILVLVPPADHAIDRALRLADGADPALMLGAAAAAAIAEELYFRGALAGRGKGGRIVRTTAWYAVFTAATGSLLLVLAAGLAGAVFGLQRRTTKGVFVPVVTHVSWELLVLLFLPR